MTALRSVTAKHRTFIRTLQLVRRGVTRKIIRLMTKSLAMMIRATLLQAILSLMVMGAMLLTMFQTKPRSKRSRDNTIKVSRLHFRMPIKLIKKPILLIAMSRILMVHCPRMVRTIQIQTIIDSRIMQASLMRSMLKTSRTMKSLQINITELRRHMRSRNTTAVITTTSLTII